MRKIITLTFLLCHLASAKAATWYVSPTGSGTGSSCGAAAGAGSLQTVINGAANGDIIYLLAGTFNISTSISISKSITLEGAGMGNTTIQSSATQLSPFSITANNVTVKNMTLRLFTGSVNLAKGFFIDGKTGINFTSVEFKDMPSGQNSEVVNIWNTAGNVSVTFTNCWWHNNANTNCVSVNRNSSTSTISITATGCVFASTENSRGFPAGIYYNQITGAGTAAANFTITNCIFSCLTGQRGAAIGMYGGNSSLKATFNVSECSFNGNTNNSSTEGGGALYVYRSVAANINQCIFDDNNASAHKGGAIYSDGQTPTAVNLDIQNSIFRNNTSSTGGGAIHLRKPNTTTATTITNCLFHNNTSTGDAGALGTESTTYNVTVNQCTFTLNNGSGTTKEALEANTGGTVLVTNSIIWGNPSAPTSNDELLRTSGTGTINNSVFVPANNTGFTGTGNSATDPALDGSFLPTSGTTAGYATPSGNVGSSAGDNAVTDESGCPSASFNYPSANPFCISPTTDTGSAPTTGGTAIANVAANDLVNGAAATLGASGNATVAAFGTWPTGITLDPNTGAVIVAANTPIDMYTLNYELCDKGTPVSCQTVSITVTVSAAAPVTWLYFEAVAQSEAVVLRWGTTNEYNNAYFEVQRSTDGTLWTPLAQVKAAEPNGAEIQSYSFTDHDPAYGKAVYYRLKQVDLDETWAYSAVRAVSFRTQRSDVLLFPNPASEVLMVSASEVIAQVRLFSISGKEVGGGVQPNDRTVRVPLAGLPKGLYFLQCVDEHGLISVHRFEVI